MNATTRPLFVLYVIWRPSCPGGQDIAESLRQHFSRDLYRAVAEGRGVSVVYRSEPVPGSRTPWPVDWDEAQETAAVVLSDATLVDDPDWVAYVRDIARVTEGRDCRLGSSRWRSMAGASPDWRNRPCAGTTGRGQMEIGCRA